jgi:uncharacterized membrane protein YfcA
MSSLPAGAAVWDDRTTRTLVFVGAPVALTILAWAAYMTATGQWGLFRTNWYMTATMVAGSFVAGASSEGGGAVAYPVMTLAFDIDPAVARNFSLAIQAVGMTAAGLCIFARRIRIETTYLGLVAAGGIPGMVLGTYGVAPFVAPAVAKMTFVSFWLSYGIALFLINHVRERTAVDRLPGLTTREKVELVGVGVVGGVLSAVFGNGIDICSFAFVTLKYRLSEKVATPTSVLLMASNALLGAFLHGAVLQDLQPQAFDFWLVCIPVVVFGAPFGAYVVSRIPRLYIAVLLYTLIGVQFVTAVWIIGPSPTLWAVSAGAFALGAGLFFGLTAARPSKERLLAAASNDE